MSSNLYLRYIIYVFGTFFCHIKTWILSFECKMLSIDCNCKLTRSQELLIHLMRKHLSNLTVTRNTDSNGEQQTKVICYSLSEWSAWLKDEGGGGASRNSASATVHKLHSTFLIIPDHYFHGCINIYVYSNSKFSISKQGIIIPVYCKLNQVFLDNKII